MTSQPAPLVSVIVTTFKRPHYLAKCLNAILTQTYRNLEVLVVEDGSDEATTSVVSSLSDARVQFYSIEHSGRPAIPRNFGLRKASGEFIAFCDDDDLWHPQKISQQVEAFIKHPGIGLCYTGVSYIDENDCEIVFMADKRSQDQKAVTFESQLLENRITFSTVMIRRDVLSDGLKFNERPVLKASEDYLFFNHIFYLHRAYLITKPLVQYRIHRHGISYSRDNVLKILFYYRRVLICSYELFRIKK